MGVSHCPLRPTHRLTARTSSRVHPRGIPGNWYLVPALSLTTRKIRHGKGDYPMQCQARTNMYPAYTAESQMIGTQARIILQALLLVSSYASSLCCACPPPPDRLIGLADWQVDNSCRFLFVLFVLVVLLFMFTFVSHVPAAQRSVVCKHVCVIVVVVVVAAAVVVVVAVVAVVIVLT